MKILKIEENKGKFTNDCGKTWKNIADISREDILLIMNIIYTNDEEIEFDNEDEINITNPAEKIIYSNIRKHLSNFCSEKQDIKKDIENNLIKILEKK